MRKMKMAMAVGAAVFVLSACGQTKEPEETRTNETASAEEVRDSADEVQEIRNDEITEIDKGKPAEDEAEEKPVISNDDVWASLVGEYDYLSDGGNGKLMIHKTPYGYGISDYETEVSYRFLTDSSAIESMEGNKIYIKYPEQVFSDGEAVFGYYILEYDTDGIDVYYGKTSFEAAGFLYHATKKTETGVYEYEGEYLDYGVNAPALEIKKNSDGTYRILIDLYRLYLLDDGVGKETQDGLEFTATGPGSGGKVKGLITLDGNVATITIFGQEWLDFAGLSEYRFYKTSDVPNVYDGSADAVKQTTAEELLDLFINGSISAVDSTDSTRTFYITDLNMDSEEWDSYSVGEKVDLDNDGENELVINGPYGGIYLDARDNQVYEFAVAEGTALVLSYTYYNGAVWIMYSNRSSAGFEFYHMEKFEGADNLAAEMNFGEELVDFDNAEAGIKYTWNGDEVSYDEYAALCSKIFAAEVSTRSGL